MENVNTIKVRRSKIIINIVLACHLSPDWPDRQQMTIENSVSIDCFYPHSSIVKSAFDCHLSGVFLVESNFSLLSRWSSFLT